MIQPLPEETAAAWPTDGGNDGVIATVEPVPEPVEEQGFEAVVSNGLQARWAGQQAVVVCAAGESSPEAEMWLFEKGESGWHAVAGPWPAMVGSNGVSKRAEGDGRAPSGAFLLGTAFGNAPKPDGVSYQYRQLDSRDRWVDAVSSPFYNRWVRGPASSCGSGEDLSKIKQYRHAVAVHYNDEAVRGVGSAIFIHVWRAQDAATHGCTAVSGENMLKLLRWLDYAKRPVLVQGTQEQIGLLLREDWNMLCLPPGWGFADDFMPDAQLEIRYNTPDNFTGKKLDGYQASLAPMRLEAIEALAGAASELRGKGMGLLLYDAYRPQQATDAMIAWAQDESDTSTKAEYYPDMDKADIPGRYVARRSAHRLGGTVDLTVLSWNSGKILDMGGPFDFFGELSAVGYAGLSSKQAANRALLGSILAMHGFEPYSRECWHFTFAVDDDGAAFAILPREFSVG